VNKDLFAEKALGEIPKILTLLDRNRHSPTYGCFDRNYWHYRIIDFPCGMAQEFVLPLALAFHTDLPGNRFFQSPAIREWVEAGILYAARSAHPDGSTDDYFPFERAGGAAAFSLLACLDAYRLLGLDNAEARRFFEKRADWLANHHESGRLTNHQALIALCLALAAEVCGTSRWQKAMEERIERVLAWQDAEGWFQEYEGCDPGYHTLTISVLGRLHAIHPSPEIENALRRAVDFAAHFVHPDGSFGGEYGSRNTYNFFPHGFELVGRWYPPALAVNDRFLGGLAENREPCYSDDHIVGHHTWNYLLAWRDFTDDRPPTPPLADGRHWFANAGLLVDRRAGMALFAALNKGGVFKLFAGGRLVASDTHVSVQTSGDKPRNAVGHLIDAYEIEVGAVEITVAGTLGWAKQKRMGTRDLLVLRVFMATVGRFFPNLVRRILQRLLVTGKKAAPFAFRRRLTWKDGAWSVEDRLSAESWAGVQAVGIGCDQTSISVVMSRTFQEGQLQGWLDLSDRLTDLKAGDSLLVERRLGP
jgi:hypothetical protein